MQIWLKINWLSLTGDPLHSRAACTQPCNVNTHSRAHCSPGARLCEQWGHGCVNNGARLCASARLCRGSPVSLDVKETKFVIFITGLSPDTQNCGLHMRRECRERFPRHWLQRKLLVSDPDMHHGTCVTCVCVLLPFRSESTMHYFVKYYCFISESCVKVLGVMLKEKLMFPEHISSLSNTAARRLNALSPISNNIDVPLWKTTYNSFIVSNFTYCALPWHLIDKIIKGKLYKDKWASLTDFV